MIKAIYESYLERAKKSKPPVSATDIVKYYREKARQLYEESLKEGDVKEDEDFETIDFKESEACPICISEQEFREYLRSVFIDRPIEYIFGHCTATQPYVTVTTIIKNWKNQGWINPGYPVILPIEGFTVIADLNMICNGVKGYNRNGLGISYTGGIDVNGKPKDTRTSSQKRLMEIFFEEMSKRFPNAKVLGHNEVANKACPSFQMKVEYPKYWTGK